jgi:hypothetical protein
MKFLRLSIITIIIFVGCQDTANITGPLQGTNSKNHLYKILNNSLYGYAQIQLPAKSPEWEDSVFTVSKDIDGEEGGERYTL